MTSFKRGAVVLDVAVVLAVEGVAGGGTVAMAVCMALSYTESALWAVIEVSIRVCSSCFSPLTRTRSADMTRDKRRPAGGPVRVKLIRCARKRVVITVYELQAYYDR